jgi:hypothetical protein
LTNADGSRPVRPHCAMIASCALLVPPALWLIGVPFEGRHNSSLAHIRTAVADLYDWTLLGLLAADLAFLIWFVWYAVGLRWRMLALAVVQFLACCYVVGSDFLWAGGPL